MAFYTAAQLYGNGSIGENLSGATTFTFVNTGDSSYFTLETIPNATGSFAGRPTCANGSWVVSGSMGAITGPYIASVVVQPGSSSLIFAPSSSITGTDYRLRGTGKFTLLIGSFAPTVPNAPAITSTYDSFTSIDVYFTLDFDGGSAVTNYQYSLNNGVSYTAFSPTQTTSPLSITGLTQGTTYAIKIRALNAIGTSSASNTVSATTQTYPLYSFATFGSQFDAGGAYYNVGGYSTSSLGALNLDVWYSASDGGAAFQKIGTGSGIATNGATWVAATKQAGGFGDGPTIIYSSNSLGTTWNGASTSPSHSLEYRAAAYGYVDNIQTNGRFVVVGSGSIANSSTDDPTNWNYQDGTLVDLYTVYNGQDGSGNNLWLAMGTPYSTIPDASFGYVSTTGASGSWTGHNMTGIDGSKVNAIRSLAFSPNTNAGKLWVAGIEPKPGISSRFAYTSNDGIAWTTSNAFDSIFQTACYAVAYIGNDIWLLGGDTNSTYPFFGCLCFYDGSTVTPIGLTLLDTCYSIACDGNYVVAVGSSATQDTVIAYVPFGQQNDPNQWLQAGTTPHLFQDGFAVASRVAPYMYPPR